MRDHTGDAVTITLSDLDESGMTITSTMAEPTIDITTISASNLEYSGIDDLVSLDDFSITLNEPIEFEDHMPEVAKIEDMCNDYPALARAYENFKSIYAMVHQDWKGRQEKDDQFPF